MDHYKIVYGGPGTEVITNESYCYSDYTISTPLRDMFIIRLKLTGEIVFMVPMAHVIYVETIIDG